MKKLIITLITVATLGICPTSQKTDLQVGMNNPTIESHSCESHNYLNTNTIPYNPNDKITIIGIDDVSQERLLEAEKIIKNFYKFQTSVKKTRIVLQDRYYYDKDKTFVDSDKFIRSFQPEDRVLFITNKRMFALGVESRGYTTFQGKVIIATDNSFMGETIIHEIGHTYGLLHCENITCVMATKNDYYDSGTFCKKCKTTINYK